MKHLARDDQGGICHGRFIETLNSQGKKPKPTIHQDSRCQWVCSRQPKDNAGADAAIVSASVSMGL